METKNQPGIKEGCGLLHKSKYGRSGDTGEKSSLISFNKCPSTNKIYLAGVNGKMIIGMKR